MQLDKCDDAFCEQRRVVGRRKVILHALTEGLGDLPLSKTTVHENHDELRFLAKESSQKHESLPRAAGRLHDQHNDSSQQCAADKPCCCPRTGYAAFALERSKKLCVAAQSWPREADVARTSSGSHMNHVRGLARLGPRGMAWKESSATGVARKGDPPASGKFDPGVRALRGPLTLARPEVSRGDAVLLELHVEVALAQPHAARGTADNSGRPIER